MQRARCRREDALVAVFPVDPEARRFLLEDLLDHSMPWRLCRPLGLDDDAVSNLCTHFYSSLLLLADVDDLGLGHSEQASRLQPHRPLVRAHLEHDRALL